jgi:hypothetical protein
MDSQSVLWGNRGAWFQKDNSRRHIQPSFAEVKMMLDPALYATPYPGDFQAQITSDFGDDTGDDTPPQTILTKCRCRICNPCANVYKI